MRKYKIVPAKSKITMDEDWWDRGPLLPSLTVYEDDETPRDTGLVDQRGCSIYSFTEKAPMGFTNRLGTND